MASISSPGIGSGLDVTSIVSQLVAAEGQLPSNRLDRKEADLQARLSSYGTLRGSVEAFQTSLAKLATDSDFQTRNASSSNDEVLVATADKNSASGNYAIAVSQLASSHGLVTDSALPAAQFTSMSDTLGTGTLTFKFGTTVADETTYTSFAQNAEISSASVNITDGSLSGIRDAINEANVGVTASIIYDGTNYRLALNSNSTGAARSMEITVSDDDASNTDASGLSLLAFNATANHLNQTNQAADAQLTVNGLAITSESNTLSNTIEGLDISLLSAGTSTLSITQDSGETKEAINSFVENYNNLLGSINSLTGYDAETQVAGTLNGDGVVLGIKSQLSRLMSTPVENILGSYSTLADIGITRNSTDGKLEVDDAALTDAIENNFDDVVDLFSASGRVSDPQISFSSFADNSQVGAYDIDITQLSTQGSLVSSVAANLTITAGVNDTFSLDLDGVTSNVTLSAGTYTTAAIVAEMQARINGASDFTNALSSVLVSEAGGVLSLTSNRYGSASKVEVTGGNGSAGLFGGAPTSTTGVDVEGTINGREAAGSGQTLTGTGLAAGIALDVTGGALGSRGTVNFSRGFADQLDTLLDELLDTDGIFQTVLDSLDDRIADVNEDRERLQLRLERFEERTRAQFVALDEVINRLTGTGNFLLGQLQSLPVIGAANRR